MIDVVKAWRAPLLLLAVAGALMTLVKCTEVRVDRKWVGAQAGAVTVAQGGKRVVETAGRQASARIEEKVDADIKAVRRAGAAARERVRRAARGAGSADLPGAASAASEPDGAAGDELTVVEDRTLALRLQLVDVAEEGDVYRAQVLGWQAWWREVEAAWALGAQVTGKPPPDAR